MTQIEERERASRGIIPSILLSTLIAGLLSSGYQGIYFSILSYANNLFPGNPNDLTYFVLVTSNVPLLIVPLALFVTIYLLARRVRLNLPRDYQALALSLFIGGTLGSAISSYSIFLFLGSQQKLPGLLSSIIYFADLVVQQVYLGVQTVFVGFTAACIESIRRRRDWHVRTI